jgi:hypothetical protein
MTHTSKPRLSLYYDLPQVSLAHRPTPCCVSTCSQSLCRAHLHCDIELSASKPWEHQQSQSASTRHQQHNTSSCRIHTRTPAGLASSGPSTGALLMTSQPSFLAILVESGW